MKHRFLAMRWILALALVIIPTGIVPTSAGAAGSAFNGLRVTQTDPSSGAPAYTPGTPATHGVPPKLGKPPTHGVPPRPATEPKRSKPSTSASGTKKPRSAPALSDAAKIPATASASAELTGTVDFAAAGAQTCQVSAYVADSSGYYNEVSYTWCDTDGSFVLSVWGDTSAVQTKLFVWLADATGTWTEWAGSSDNTRANASVFAVPDGGTLSTGLITPHVPERITGKIGNLASIGASACSVDAFREAVESYGWSTSAECGEDGSFTITIDWTPAPPPVTIQAWPRDAGHSWAEWVGSTDNRQSTATTYDVPPSATTDMGTITLHAPERITGTVTNVEQVGATRCGVAAYVMDSAGSSTWTNGGGCAQDGMFTIVLDWSTTTVSVKLQVQLDNDSSWWAEWVGSRDNSEQTATIFHIAPSDSTSAGTITLHAPARFTGKVGNLQSVTATGCSIELWSENPSSPYGWGSCTTDGGFDLISDWTPVRQKFTVQVQAYSLGGDWTEWVGSAENLQSTATVYSAEPSTTVDLGTIGIHQPVIVSGTVTLPPEITSHGSVPLSFYDADGRVLFGSTDETGTYSRTLGFGTYTIGFARQSGTYPYAGQFYNGVSEDKGPASAAKLILAPGQSKSGVSGTLVAGGTITGKLLNGDGSPAQGALALAYADDGVHTTRGWATADVNGNYEIKGLSSGAYRVVAQRSGPSSIPDRWSGNEGEEQYAQLISVTSGEGTHIGDLTFAPPTFSDVPDGRVFYGEISWLAAKGISTGWQEADGTRTYRPLVPVARDAMAAFLYRLAGKPAFTPPSASPFPDVPLDYPFYKEITWLASMGISTGWPQPDGTKLFKPADPVARDAMAAFLYRFAGKPAFTPPSTSPFPDVPLDYPFYKEITWLASTGISTGWPQPDGTKLFKPADPVARDAMAAFMYRYNTKQLPMP